LTATTFGIWLIARVDPHAAARICETVVTDVRSWRRGAAN
jgi:hypothetical protein